MKTISEIQDHEKVKILDVCCGSRMFWFDKNEPHTTFMDIRKEQFEIHGKKVNVQHLIRLCECINAQEEKCNVLLESNCRDVLFREGGVRC